jgi:hypothetical protein
MRISRLPSLYKPRLKKCKPKLCDRLRSRKKGSEEENKRGIQANWIGNTRCQGKVKTRSRPLKERPTIGTLITNSGVSIKQVNVPPRQEEKNKKCKGKRTKEELRIKVYQSLMENSSQEEHKEEIDSAKESQEATSESE